MTTMNEAFSRAGYTIESDSQEIVSRIFLEAFLKSRELKDIFKVSPKLPKDFERIEHNYAIFADGYNAGYSSASHFRTPEQDEQLPISFSELSQVISGSSTREDDKIAWNRVYFFLRNHEVSGLYEEPHLPETIDTMIGLTRGLVQNLLDRDALSPEVIRSINIELREVSQTIGRGLQGLKKDERLQFEQLMERIVSTLQTTGVEYDESRVIASVRNILSHIGSPQDRALSAR